jgi:hypothetical protein
MKNLGAALAIAFLAIAGAFSGLVYLGLDADAAAQVATAIIGSVPYIREFLERTFPIQRKSNSASVEPLDNFGLPPQRMILYGTLLIVGAMELGSGLGGLSADVLGETRDRQRLHIMAIVSSLIQFPIIFSVGRWVGRRITSYGIAVIFIISLLARLGTTLLDAGMLTPAGMTALLGIDVTLATLSVFVAGGTVVFFLVALIGYWRGRRQRLAAYLSYLLRSVPEDTRKAIVDLAFEEARATLTRGG